MSQTVLPIINALFNGIESPRKPVVMTWRLVRRKRQPLLLLPQSTLDPAVGMELYSAQRALARMWRSVVPRLMKTPAVNFFERVSLQTDAASDWMQFLAEQSGLPAGQMPVPAIKFGGVAGRTSRVVLLLCDNGGYPVRVVKVGLDAQGRAVTEREADLLSRLPEGVIGCTGITGRFSNENISAFATAFFQGNSLANDIGIEKLFHAWLNPEPREPIEHLASWNELESVAKDAAPKRWPVLRHALGGQMVRTTLFHGDFTPWNVRMTNLENIRAFDWERGHLQGMPGWDWFHFIVQTSVLAKRHSPERVAAELEQLFRSPRFQNYAQATGISDVVEPLLLAYLLHQQLVIQPLEGAKLTRRLFDLLWLQWRWRRKLSGHTEFVRRPATLGPRQQVKTAFADLANLFWEPSLSPNIQPSFGTQLARHWKAVLGAVAWLGGVATLHCFAGQHLLFMPFYLLPCIWLALKTDGRVAFLFAFPAAFTGPWLYHRLFPELLPLDVVCWNILMRLVIFQLIIILLDSLRKYGTQPQKPDAERDVIQAISGSWAVIAAAGVIFTLVAVLDARTNPDLISLYVLPCIMLTLALNWRWGTALAALAAVLGPILQHDDPAFHLPGIMFWNTAMRFVIFETVVLLLERIRRQNILFQADNRR